jgi:hypothetical protein
VLDRWHGLLVRIGANVYRNATRRRITSKLRDEFRGGKRFGADYHQKSSGKAPDSHRPVAVAGRAIADRLRTEFNRASSMEHRV